MPPCDIKYTKGDVKRAGEFLRKNLDSINIAEHNQAHEVLSYWRASHIIPMQAMIKSIRDKAYKIDPDAIIVQRLKRTPSIILKLKRENGMQLDRMEDIMGCRVVVASIKQVKELRKLFKKWRTKHILQRERDYLTYVKESGYRGIHLVYKYNGRHTSYHGRPIELQLRSRAQHSWATAVEVVGTFTKQTLKASIGDDEWLSFFKLASIAFADMENGRLTKNSDSIDRYNLREITEKLSVIEKLNAFASSIKHLGKGSNYPADYYLLILNIETNDVSFKEYNKKDLNDANKIYSQLEKKYGDDTKQDVVLVAASSLESLKKAYPNYFADTNIFSRNLQLVLDAK